MVRLSRDERCKKKKGPSAPHQRRSTENMRAVGLIIIITIISTLPTFVYFTVTSTTRQKCFSGNVVECKKDVRRRKMKTFPPPAASFVSRFETLQCCCRAMALKRSRFTGADGVSPEERRARRLQRP